MPEPSRRPTPPVLPSTRSGAAGPRRGGPAFLGLFDPVIVEEPVEFTFDGALPRDDADAMWTWVVRDIAPDLIDRDAPQTEGSVAAMAALAPELLTRIRAALAKAQKDSEAQKELRTQLGTETAWDRMPTLVNALRCVPLVAKAQAFGRAVNGIQEEAALNVALKSMPLQDAGIAAILMMVAVGQVTQPGRLVVSATRIVNETNEIAIHRYGFGPLIDAMLAQAQNCIPVLRRAGAFTDMDRVCRAVERFHRLTRGVAANLELFYTGRWATTIAALTKTISARLEPKVRDVMPDVNRALRRQREGQDRLDGDAILAALNGVYLLETIRECRDSLALNEAFDQAWAQTGQALEMHLTRNLDSLREAPGDAVTAGRLDAGIKMAEIRFGAEYADVLRKARDGVQRRVGPSA